MPPTQPIALYIHFPWCTRKCPYCDFNSHAVTAGIPEQAYIQMLLRDLDSDLAQLDVEPRLTSIFMGGGTPSLFQPAAIAALMTGIKQRMDLPSSIEITMEANPGTTDYAKFQGYVEAGVNRLSIGVQSFNDQQLQALGRIHSAADAARAFTAARTAGFSNINIDLMHGLPGQSLAAAMGDLEQALALGPDHLSWYQLTIEPNTGFYRFPPTLPDDDALWAIYSEGLTRLATAGLNRYEVSAFATAGKQSAHNLNYWQFGDYLGIGAGAHGKWKSLGRLQRTTKTRAPKDYLQTPNPKTRVIDAEQIQLEFLMNSLRLNAGFSWATFEANTGLAKASLDAFVQQGTNKGLLAETPTGLQATPLGIQFLNDLLLLVD
ncbi:MAG: radical SAM family heme chaperone HemW [Pseudomonadales bacterium]|nr:radical SAM family heme chaperone HemW [Pseudomonadales bacterium]MDP4641438.1 radical SAM family heme chaperone HemW [Pseudomonadales bacterium]MDP4766679.1 radical SAM family heme chaperone HemW [Pseudomonadales bacterium]MDP4875124.1 radical SAM family heme chaperone HemW [Pseudomonadales bacterium]MDP4911298.1 radical SAM family heme chaperone HemW [Pseudomonadales bacterium]